MRIGFGSDIHRLVEGHPLMLGGIMIPSERGEAAHSDGDVLLHTRGRCAGREEDRISGLAAA